MTSLRQKASTAQGSAGKSAGLAPAAKNYRRRRFRVVAKSVFGLLLIGAAIAGVSYWQFWPVDLCRQCESRVTAASDEAVPAAMRQLDSLGPRGLTAMVRFLNSPRVALRRTAHERLTERLDGLRRATSAAERETLAAIADGLEQLTASGRTEMHTETVAFAWELLEAVGNLSLEDQISQPDRGRLLVACDKVLQRPTPTVEAPAAQSAWTMPVGDGLPLVTSNPQRDTGPPREQGDSVRTEMPAPIASPRPRPVQPVAAPTPLASVPNLPRSAANAAARVNPIRGPQSDSNVRPASAANAVTPPHDQPAPMPAADRPLDIQARTAWELFAALREAGTLQAAAAETELNRRGFTPREIELGKHLTSTDDAERRRYTESLPSIPGVAVRPWLLHLCDDPSAEVRLAAAAIMGTTNDPALLTRLREMGLNDPDQRVRMQAQRATIAPVSR